MQKKRKIKITRPYNNPILAKQVVVVKLQKVNS